MAFIDEATIFVRAGAGGDGAATFRRQPYEPKGPPDGGNGGNGGSVLLEVSKGVHDLSWLARHPHQRAKAGRPGSRNNRTGADGADVVIRVPDGTVVRNEQGFVADLAGTGARVVVARGGRGGRGNASLASPKNRAPREAERGEPGEEHTVELEVRTIADAGLVGLPSAGKSTLLAAMTAARPKIAAYPFTTLSPNVGVAGGEGERFVLADVPGLIEGAHAGKGLGDRFLRHVMRCPVLVVVVDLTSENPVEDVRVVRDELASYDASLAERPYLIAATKCDLAPDGGAAAAGRLSEIGETLRVSGETGEGVEELLDRLGRLVVAAPRPGPEDRPAVVLRPGRPAFTVTEEAGRFRVSGTRVERWVSETDFDDPRSVAALQDRLAKEGVERKLAAAGARRGDEVMIGDRTFEYLPEED